MRKFCSIIIVTVVLTLLSGLGAQAQRRIDDAVAKLPDGDGKSEVIAYCAGVCHPASRFVNMRQSPQEWHKTVMLMVAFGAQLFPEDAATITKYLSTYLSTQSPPQSR
jgi:hypothetical protein